jgi:formylglycine-generating enzyme required for sulfatase activity
LSKWELLLLASACFFLYDPNDAYERDGMRNPIKPLRLGLFSLLCLSSVWAADLKTYKEVYQKNSEEILQSFQSKFTDLQQQYQKALVALKVNAVKQGDLTKTKAAITEIDRFQKAKSLPAAQDENEIQEIKAFQAAYVKQYSVFETDMTAKLGALTAKYEQALDRLQKELVKAEKLDEATAVQGEKEQAKTALNGYADRLSALTGQAATNAPPVAATQAQATAAWKTDAKSGLYLVVDLSRLNKANTYPVTFLADVPKGGWPDEYKTDKLVLRKTERGTFVMGSPEGELGRDGAETRHEVKLKQAFYIGVFEVSQKQWERVMGDWPSNFNNPKYREARPVEKVSYTDIRGSSDGSGWPASSSVDTNSFMGRLRVRTGKAFDLPTEAQWEYACRAGATTALNSGKNLTSAESCPNLADVARYKGNAGELTPNGDTREGTAKVGRYLPNAWGLYDFHGNVWEWCLDWRGNYSGAERDPKGSSAGAHRVFRGGGWYSCSGSCRSAYRGGYDPGNRSYDIGFRVALPADQT